MPRAASMSSSPISVAGLTTTPLPMTDVMCGYRTPDGTRWSLSDLVAEDDRVAGVVAALVADDDRDLLGEEVGRLALALVAPLEADHDRGRASEGAASSPSPGGPGQAPATGARACTSRCVRPPAAVVATPRAGWYRERKVPGLGLGTCWLQISRGSPLALRRWVCRSVGRLTGRTTRPDRAIA